MNDSMDLSKSINCPYFFTRGMCNAYNEENKNLKGGLELWTLTE